MKDKIKMNGYQKIKFIINEFLKKRAVSAKDSIFEYNGISIDTVQNIITKLNKANMIYKFDKETNKIKNDLIDKTIFSNDNYNNNFISSIISREEVNSENTIKYFFKQVPDNLIFMTNNKYSINFNDQIIPLLDSKKYNAFSSLIINNTDIHKSTCRINHEEDIVPLELFIYGSSWYVCAHNIKTKENIIIDSYNIKYFQKLNEYYSLYINDKQITETIEKFIKESVKEEYFFLKLKPELLNILLNFKLIDEEYEVYDEEKELNNKYFITEIVFLPDKFQKLWSSVDNNNYYDNYYKIERYLESIISINDYILIQGEWGYTHSLINWSIKKKIIPIYSFSERKSKDTISGEQITKISYFEHIEFKEYF